MQPPERRADRLDVLKARFGVLPMNKIVREHYPVDQLPKDLRASFQPGATVTVIVQEDAVSQTMSGADTVAQLEALRNSIPVADDDPVERIRKLRDEWDR